MVCLGSVLVGSRQVWFSEERITLSDRKPGNPNFLMTGLRDTRVSLFDGWLSLDNQSSDPHTGDH